MSELITSVPGVYHPWRALRALNDQVTVVWQNLDAGILGLTDGEATIWMDPRQRQAKRRCTMAHELAHIELGHRGGCSVRDDAAADQLAARRLIPLECLADALAWTDAPDEIADELWVDRATLEVRLAHLHPSERAYLSRRAATREGAC